MLPINIGDYEEDWLASLAQQSISSDNNANKPQNKLIGRRKGREGGKFDAREGRSHGAHATNSSCLTKAKWIERREQTKARREEYRRSSKQVRTQRLAKKQTRSKSGYYSVAVASWLSSPVETHAQQRREKGAKRGMTATSKIALANLSTALDATLSSRTESSKSHAPRTKRHKSTHVQEIINGLPATEPKGKATNQGTLRTDSRELQPRTRDYNGQGLVLPSLYLPFDDPSFLPKLEIEFSEHVPGFFGKAKQKAAKRQTAEAMLWRRCLRAKEKGGESMKAIGSGKTKKKRKRGKGLDKKVEGMIQKWAIM